jgi:dTDP-4-amino-4,6-dideoxygalactose transaminase
MIEEKKLAKPINVTKPFLPPVEEYQYYIQKIFDKCWLTNQGPLLSELEDGLSKFLDVDNFHFVANGTIALQLAIKALGIEQGEIITTPFSYVATSSSILWEKCKPVFVDIESNNFTIDAGKIEQAITPKTKAIMAVHVFGYACDVDKIDKIAQKYNLKVIYDAAHAFGAKYKDKSLLNYGDISTCSFHSTKLFHTIEGGACIVKDKEINEILELSKRFGHNGDEHIQLGINAKNSEMHAAMGLANLPYIEKIIQNRKQIAELYDKFLPSLQKPLRQEFLEYNYAYYPVIFESEKQLLKVFDALNKENIFPRRYFYPSLNKINYIQGENCPISENISPRIACLPLYCGLEKEQVEKISNIMKRNL